MVEPISPELVLVDPELGARARAALPLPAPVARPSVPASVSASTETPHKPAPESSRGRYPVWARVTAALWILVVGILIGGAAIPHAQDQPRLEPLREGAALCTKPSASRPSLPHTVVPGLQPGKPAP